MKKNFPLAFIGFLVLVNIFIWSSVLGGPKEGMLTVSFLDVGQGDAIFIESPTGFQVLIDSGRDNSVLRELGKVMSFDDRSIDALLATHPDADHIGGFPGVLENYQIDAYIDGGSVAETGVYREVERLVEEEGSVRMLARRGMVLDIGGGVLITVLFPDRDVSHTDPNDASLITKIEYGESTFLLTGDAPSSVEEYISSLDGEYLDVDVLKVGHHGSKTSSSEEFVDFVTPEYAVISAGEDNSYGHPHQVVLDTLNKHGANVLSTYKGGMIVFVSDGKDVYISRK